MTNNLTHTHRTRLHTTQEGLGMAGIFVIVLIIVSVALGGALAYKIHEDRSLSSTQSDTTVPKTDSMANETTGSTDTSQTTKVAAHSLDEGNTFVDDTYQQYIQTQSKNMVGAKDALERIRSKLTPDLYNTISAKYVPAANRDEIVCAQALPSTFGVDSNVQNAGIADYTVNEMFGSTNHPVKVTVDLNQLLISNITCST